METPVADGGVKDYYTDWQAAIQTAKMNTYKDAAGNDISSDEAYQAEKATSYAKYIAALDAYNDALAKHNSGLTVDIDGPMANLSVAKNEYSDCMTFDNWLKSKAAYEYVENPETGETEKKETEVYKNVQQYYVILEEMLEEAENLGCSTLEETYVYSDETKATWYKNLWYRMNGESSDKSAQGKNATNYTELDSKLASSKQWIQDALTQGLITLEVASNEDATNLIPDMDNPTSVLLQGISWRTTTYSSCIDFTEKDDDSAIAKAEAEYQRKNNEISAQDKKYENKIKTLDTEHTSLQTEYESVKSAMNKNIDRSFKTFS